MKTFVGLQQVFFILIITIASLSYSQTSQLTLGGTNYVFKNNNWYVIDNSSGIEYLVNQKSMTVKLKNGVSTAVLVQLNLANNVIKVNENSLGYINLKLPNTVSFEQMYNLYNQAGLFDYIYINSYGEIHSNDPAYSNQNPNPPNYQY